MKTLNDFNIMKTKKKPWEVEGVEWREVKLGEACTINPKKSEVRHLLNQNIKVSFIPMDHVDDIEGKIIKKEIKPITSVYKGYTYFKEGDILFAKITPCMENGKSAVARNLTNGIGFGSTEFHVLRPKEGVLSEFVFYFIRRKRFRNLAKLHFTGTVGHKRVPKEFLINSKIPLPFRNGKPDLETQKKIVEYIEANFSRIDKILEKKKRELEQLDELWESILEQAFKPKEGEEWREVRLLDKVNLIKGTKPKKVRKTKIENALPYLTTEYFRNGIVKEYVPIEEDKITLVQEGDLVIIADGSRSGELFFCDIEGVTFGVWKS
jgi:type I restriction enzyme S subunit